MFELRATVENTIEILMYGTIAQWEKVNAKDFVTAVDNALKSNPKTIVFPIHSPGGEIGEGVAMGNKVRAIRRKGVKTIGRVDGLAASMASVFAASCDEVEVTPFSRMMVHEGRGGVYGTVKQMRDKADLLESYNKDIASIYSEKTGKEEKWILENWMAEGKDTWFTAQEAVDAKLADRKTPAVVKQLPRLAAINDWNAMAAQYDPFFNEATIDTTETEMNKEQLIKLLGLKAEATEAEITAALTAMKAKADTAPEPEKTEKAKGKENPSDDSKNLVAESVVELAKSKGVTDEKVLNAIKAVAATDVQAAIALIPAKEEAKAEKTISMNELIAAIKGDNGASTASGDRKNWKISDWQKNDSAGLLKMAQEKPAEYAKLFAAHYGYEPSIDEIKKLTT